MVAERAVCVLFRLLEYAFLLRIRNGERQALTFRVS
jgi:hypothetical protein